MNLWLGWADREGVGMATRGGGRIGWLLGFSAKGAAPDSTWGERRGRRGQLWSGKGKAPRVGQRVPGRQSQGPGKGVPGPC